MATNHDTRSSGGRSYSSLPYHCMECGKSRSFYSLDALRLHIQVEHQTPDRLRSSTHTPKSHRELTTFQPQYSPRRGLSPNAQELGRQISVARQLMQKQQRAEFKATSLLGKHRTPRPAAHITPRKKDIEVLNRQSQKAATLSDEDTSHDGALLKKSFATLGLKSHPSANTSIVASAKRQSQSYEKPESQQFDSSKDNGKKHEELVEKWKTQSEIRRLEARLLDKTRQVDDLQRQVTDTARVAQEKDRNLRELNAFLQDATVKQSVAKQKLRYYVDDLADRAMRAESEVDDLRTSLTMSKTESSSRSPQESEHQRQKYYLANQSQPATHSKINYSEILHQNNNSLEELSPNSYNIRSLLGKEVPRTFTQNSSPFHQSNYNTSSSQGDDSYHHSYRPPPEAPIKADHVQPANHALPTLSHDQNYEATQYQSTYLPSTMSSHRDGGPSDGNVKNGQDWNDMDFLEDVIEDVLSHRQEQEMNANNNKSSYLAEKASVANVFPSTSTYGRSPGVPNQGQRGRHLNADEDSDSSSDVSVTSVSKWSEVDRGGYFLPRLDPLRRKSALLCVFSYLPTSALLQCGAVCREWREVSRNPELWQYVCLRHKRISAQLLKTMSTWCTQLKWLTLEKLSPRKQRPGEGQDAYHKKIRGEVEPGVEELLRGAGSDLLTLKIVDCPHILTERVLWLASCYSRNLHSLTYISRTDPVGPEVVWALGAGCRQIKSLKIPPRHPCERPKKFSSSCVTMISRCWNQLQALSVGGPHVKPEALALIAKSCPKLQVLELDHMMKVTEDKASELCHNGLRGLHTLILRHTPITPSAVIHFNGACPHLTRISVHLSLSDFFSLPASPGQRKEFSKAVETLMSLTRKASLEDTLHVRADYK